ncbi:AT-rich interactive domain-containing protein 2 [Bienertia sinuspersici]
MAHKRPFDDEVVDEGSSKHQKQEGSNVPSDEIKLCNDNLFVEGDAGKPDEIGSKSSIGNDELELRQVHEKGSCPVIPRELVEEVESDAPRSASLSHWATSSTSDDDEQPEELVQLPFYPGYFSFDHAVRPAINPVDMYYCLLDLPPRKQVPVGLIIKQIFLVWGLRLYDGIIDGKLDEICIMPCPKVEPTRYNSEKVGDGRTECRCPDQGSIRCVQQHIAEARDKLRRTLGEDTFMELGFYDMGEVVAEKWSEEERHLFHEVVYSNPASLGKNFWNVLSVVFPSRTRMEIVSYYFNVFMLRKRAQQNRCDAMNIDSDNDEWQGSDDDGGDDGEVSDDNEDSGVESPFIIMMALNFIKMVCTCMRMVMDWMTMGFSLMKPEEIMVTTMELSENLIWILHLSSVARNLMTMMEKMTSKMDHVHPQIQGPRCKDLG